MGEKYLTQWDDEAKNSEKTKVFEALSVRPKPLGGFCEQVFLSFSRKKARFIFVFLMFCCVKFFSNLFGKNPYNQP